MALMAASAAEAQEYRFSVPEVKMLVTVNADASTRVEYDFVFQNAPHGHPIDVVDIGTFHAGYDLKNVRAWIDGRQLHDFRPSTVVKPGFEVHLGGGTIPPGKSGRFRVEFTMPEMVYQDTTNADNASLRITPTWFGDQYVIGQTHLQIAIQLPKSIRPEEALYHDQLIPFTLKALTPDGTRVGWDFPATRLTDKHMVGVSFPKRDMQHVIRITAIGMLVKWFSESPGARLCLAIVFFILLGIAYFRFTGGTGISVYVVLCAAAGVLFAVSPVWHLVSMPLVVMLIAINEWCLERRKTRYMPPIAQVEGGGIKRGLTAPEAAVLLELPLAKVLSLVVFGLLKKGVLRQVAADPLHVAVNDTFCIKGDPAMVTEKQREEFYRDAAFAQGTVIHKYEHPFLFLIQTNPAKPLKDINFALPVKQLIVGVAERMKGFDLSDTKDYYRSIVSRAVGQAAAIGEVAQREQTIDRNFEWILMGDNYGPVFDYGRPYRPVWTRGSAPSLGGGGQPAAPSVPSGTSFGDVASSFSGWAENTMGKLTSAISPDVLNLPGKSGGFLDLSGADRVTGEFFQALSEAASSAGSGGGGGCACACAGCACACACAGGGR
jgi:hypothetical protein